MNHVPIAVIGHSGSGKSTLIGQLRYKRGDFDSNTITRLSLEARSRGKEGLQFAWLSDTLRAERERGQTMDIHIHPTTSRQFSTTIIDTPGDIAFFDNTIAGIGLCSAVMLVVSADTNQGKALDQFHEYARSCLQIGYNQRIRHSIVAINKMDAIDWSERRYRDISAQINEIYMKIGMGGVQHLVPTSGWRGDHVVDKSDRMKWYNGPTLVEAIDNISSLVASATLDIDDALRFTTASVDMSTGNTVAVTRLETLDSQIPTAGTILRISPGNMPCELKSIEQLSAGTLDPRTRRVFWRLTFKGLISSMTRGVLIHNSSDRRDGAQSSITAVITARYQPPEFYAEGAQMEVPFWKQQNIRWGDRFILYCHTARVPCRLRRIIEAIDIRTGKPLEFGPHEIMSGQSARVEIDFLHPVAMAPRLNRSSLNSFALFYDPDLAAEDVAEQNDDRRAAAEEAGEEYVPEIYNLGVRHCVAIGVVKD